MKNKTGFTLVELLAVIVILGVLLLIAVPAVTNIIDNTKKKAFITDCKAYLQAAKYNNATEGADKNKYYNIVICINCTSNIFTIKFKWYTRKNKFSRRTKRYYIRRRYI